MQLLLVAVAVFSFILLNSWHAAIIIGVVGLVQLCVGAWLTARTRYLMWGLVLLRLVIPVFPSSGVSVMNWVPDALFSSDHGNSGTKDGQQLLVMSDDKGPQDESVSLRNAAAEVASSREFSGLLDDGTSTFSTTELDAPATWIAQVPNSVPKATVSPGDPAGESNALIAPNVSVRECLAAVWILGIAFFGMRMFIARRLLSNLLAKATFVAEGRVFEMANECRNALKVTRRVQILVTEENISPAVLGVLNPRILLPQSVVDTFSDQELRCVLLHEFAHVKYHDTAVHLISELIRVAYWFNPFVWYATQRLRFERELACDAVVLSCVKERDAGSYGRTTIKLIELLSDGRPFTATVGILDRKPAVLRRITMIGKFRKPSYLRALFSLFVLTSVGLVSLTDAAPPVRTPDETTRAVSSDGDDKKETINDANSYGITLRGFRYPGESSDEKAEIESDLKQFNDEIAAAVKSAMPAEGGSQKTSKDDGASSGIARLRLYAGKDGALSAAELNSETLAPGDDVFDRLAQKMKTWANADGRPPIEKREVEIQSDYELNYEFITKAISACTGRENPDSGEIERFVERIKFASPQELTDLAIKLGYMRSADGARLSDKLVVMIGESVTDMATAADTLKEWLQKKEIAADAVVLTIACDRDAQSAAIQNFIKLAQPIGFRRVALRNLKPVDDEAQKSITVFTLRHVDATEIAKILREIFGGTGPDVVPDARTNSVLVTADETDMRIAERVIARLDGGLDAIPQVQHVRVFALKELDPVGTAKTLQAIFSNVKAGAPIIEADSKGSRIIVRADLNTQELIQRMLIQLGESPPEDADGHERKSDTEESKRNSSMIHVDESAEKVVFLIDNSASMAGDHQRERIQIQLRSFLGQLRPDQQFQVLFFNETTTALAISSAPKSDMYDATSANVYSAIVAVGRLQPQGGTDYLRSLTSALRLDADAIYLMTDGDQPAVANSDLQTILNRHGNETRFHVTELDHEQSGTSGTSWLQSLATLTQGTYGIY